MMNITDKIKNVIRDIKDFPKEGIVFKDITPILLDPKLCKEIVDEFVKGLEELKPDAIACVEARGFFFGTLIAQRLQIPFIPIRKQGKLPYETVSHSYDLEYGSATIEMHEDAVKRGWKVLLHDDLLATGGTASAAAELVTKKGGEVVGFSFLVDLTFLDGKEVLTPYCDNVVSLVEY
jgi:adenine phosphoribosyltransferase